jgi:toxin-antitoxin system PIN domain toxin
VNFIVACGWESHAEHETASAWLDRVGSFATCPITEMGFLRVSLSPAYGANFRDAIAVLNAILETRGHRFLRDETHAVSLPQAATSTDVTDAHLVHIARRFRLKLATFDAALCAKEWARGVAENPTR